MKNKEQYAQEMEIYRKNKEEESANRKKEEDEMDKLRKHEAMQLLKKKEKTENLIKVDFFFASLIIWSESFISYLMVSG